MATSTTVIVRDPADPRGLFDAARRIAGDAPLWHEHDFGDVLILQAESGQGALAQVSVHFPAAGGSWHDDGNPEGFALVLFTTSGPDDLRARHERLAGELLNLLAERGLKAAWRYEDDPWTWS